MKCNNLSAHAEMSQSCLNVIWRLMREKPEVLHVCRKWNKRRKVCPVKADATPRGAVKYEA